MITQFSYDVEIYRLKSQENHNYRDAWGNLVANPSPSTTPALYGREYSHTIHNAVVAPRTTGIEKSAPANAQLAYTGKTMYVEPGADIHQDDYVKYVDEAGKTQVYKVEGEGDTNLFVSPYTSFAGGVEVHLQRVVETI